MIDYPSKLNLEINDTEEEILHLIYTNNSGVNPEELTKLLSFFISDGSQMKLKFIDVSTHCAGMDDDMFWFVCSATTDEATVNKYIQVLNEIEENDGDIWDDWSTKTGKHMFLIGY